jgi:hypothetical protein
MFYIGNSGSGVTCQSWPLVSGDVLLAARPHAMAQWNHPLVSAREKQLRLAESRSGQPAAAAEYALKTNDG